MGSAYKYIYIIVLGIIIWRQYTFPTYISPFNISKHTSNNLGAFLLMVACVLFIGLRPIDVSFADMVGYSEIYNSFYNTTFSFDKDAENLVFDQIAPLFASQGLSLQCFFTFIACIYFGGIYLACHKLFLNNLLVSFITCITAFSAFSYGTNGIKAGAAASIFLVALAYKNKPWLSIILSLLSWGFHHSMSVVLIAYVCSLFCRTTKWYFFFWIVSTIIAILHISYFQILFAGLTDEKGAGYLITSEDSFLTGFRLDFILYSAVPILFGFYFFFKNKIRNKEYNLWLRMYLLTNSVWMLSMYASYSNRIAYLSWFLYPIVLIFPFLKEKWSERQTIYTKQIICCHYLFTAFMECVYYNLIK